MRSERKEESGITAHSLPADIGRLLRCDWDLITEQALFDDIDRLIVQYHIIGRMPQVDAAAAIGVDRKTVSRRLPGIIDRSRFVMGRLNM